MSSIKHNAGIILIFLKQRAVLSENCEKCIQILPATHSRMYKVDKSDFGIIECLVTTFCRASKLHLLVKCLIEQLLFNINFKNERLGMFFQVQDYGGGVEVSF